jgi:hypothetical protein
MLNSKRTWNDSVGHLDLVINEIDVVEVGRLALYVITGNI